MVVVKVSTNRSSITMSPWGLEDLAKKTRDHKAKSEKFTVRHRKRSKHIEVLHRLKEVTKWVAVLKGPFADAHLLKKIEEQGRQRQEDRYSYVVPSFHYFSKFH